MGRKRHSEHRYISSFCACIVVASLLLCGCSRFQIRSSIEEADAHFSRGNYDASLRAYEQILATYPQAGDRALFEMGIIHAYPQNERKDYRKALECFERLIRDYPGSTYRLEAERMILHITNVTLKDRRMEEQQALIESLRKEVKDRDDQLAVLARKVEALERKVFLMEQGPADRILIEKKERRLTLFAKGLILKTYRIALGGNPEGPKERQGDNKTPEGIYCIDARNRDSRYHLSLHISYPNERDRKRARKLGVSPGGDIMIHGIKNGFSAVGDLHTAFDWTKGCIAVTDEEIEEIDRLVPNGTIVEIRP